MNQPLRFDRIDGKSIYFVNPLHPTDRLRIGAKVSSKPLSDGSKTQAQNTDFNLVRVLEVATCATNCEPPTETIGIRVEFNSSLKNRQRLIDEWDVLKVQIDSVLAADGLNGLKPGMNSTFEMYEPDPVAP